MQTNYYTVDQVAKKLNLSLLTIRRYIKAKKLSAYKIGREYRIEKVDFDKFMIQLNFVKNFTDWFSLKPSLDSGNYPPPKFSEKQVWYCHCGENIGVEICGKGEGFYDPTWF